MTKKLHELTEPLVRQAENERRAYLESYIQEYLKVTGKKIEDFVLCHQVRYDGPLMITSYWLEPRNDK